MLCGLGSAPAYCCEGHFGGTFDYGDAKVICSEVQCKGVCAEVNVKVSCSEV